MALDTMSRRRLLRMGGAFSMLGAGAPFALQLAAAGASATTTTPNYKALVCVFLYGGNDANNMVLATDSDSWNRYSSARNTGTSPIALSPLGSAATASRTTPQGWGGVIPITPDVAQPIPAGTDATTRTFALHPFMSEAQGLFNAGRMAIVANVGPLIQPTTKASYVARTVAIPSCLFSHNDQQSEWQAGGGGGEGARAGWGGRMGDYVLGQNGPNTVFTAISPSGNAVFLSGQTVVQYIIGTGSQPAILISGDQGSSLLGSSAGPTALSSIITDTTGSSNFASDYAAVVNRSINAAGLVNGAFAQNAVTTVTSPPTFTNPLTGAPEVNSLAVQLHTVAQMVAAAPSLGLTRQVFFVALGGFDNHKNQNQVQPNLLGQLSEALGYFDNALTNIGGVDRSGQVTTFTASEFSRTWTTNGSGTDHAWGSHHLVMGAAVKGRNIYGQFPTVGIDLGGFTNPDMLGNAFIPTTSVDQYAATLGAWFGVPASTLGTIFPNLHNFPTTDLGFV